MAILKLGAIVTTISGKLGGQTFVNGSQGNYVKTNGNIKKTPTTKQSTQRAQTKMLMSAWRNLSQIQLKSWYDEVGNWDFKNRVGEVKSYTAFQIFMLQNQGRLLFIDNLQLIAGPKEIMNVYNWSIDNTSTNSLEVIGNSLDANTFYILWASPKISRGITNAQAYWRKISVMRQADLAGGYDFTQDYLDAFGIISAKDYINVEVQAVHKNNGQRAPRSLGQFFIAT